MTAEQPQPQTLPARSSPRRSPRSSASPRPPTSTRTGAGPAGHWQLGSWQHVDRGALRPDLALRFEAASAEILAVADHLFLRLEHIGSTSVPGLAAKPTIDMMASVRRLQDGHAAQPALAALGYELADTGMRERLFFQRLAGPGVSITARAARNDARTDIAAAVAPITLASLPDMHLGTANTWAEASSGSWSRYLDDPLVIEEDDRVDTQP
jgi:GrpB protein